MPKTLRKLLENLNIEIHSLSSCASEKEMLDLEITDVVSDTRRLCCGCMYICCRITNYNGFSTIADAIRAGAAVILSEPELYYNALAVSGMSEKAFLGSNPPDILFTQDTRYAMAFIYAAMQNNPARSLITVGVTGTKGKTSVCNMLWYILEEAGYKTGLISTGRYILDGKYIESASTTPEADILQSVLRKMVQADTDAVVLEISSQALMTHRSQGFTFDIGAFINIGYDHISPDEHKNFDHYLYCKSLLMRQCRTGIVNADDPYTVQILEGHTCAVQSFGIIKKAELMASGISYEFMDGMPGVAFDTEGIARMNIRLPQPGYYSVSNALAAIRIALSLKVPEDAIVKGLSKVRILGRTEVILPDVSGNCAFPVVIVDYAHNGMSLRALLKTMKQYYKSRIICVFGVSRMLSRGRELGAAAGELADYSVITTDNSYAEDPQTLLNSAIPAMEEVKGAYTVIPDRVKAIQHAISISKPEDLVVIAGRGRDKNLIMNDGVHIYPDDVGIVRRILGKFE